MSKSDKACKISKVGWRGTNLDRPRSAVSLTDLFNANKNIKKTLEQLENLPYFSHSKFDPQGRVQRSKTSIKGHLPSKVFFHQKLSSIKDCLLSKIVFHQRLPSIKGHLPSKVALHQKSTYIEGYLRTKVVFY